MLQQINQASANYANSFNPFNTAAPSRAEATCEQLGLSDEAANALDAADAMNNLLDDLEARLFGTSQAPAGADPRVTGALSVSHALSATRQRLDTAVNRLSQILKRL